MSEPPSVPVIINVHVVDAAVELFVELERLLGSKAPDAVSERNRSVRVLKAFDHFVGRAWLELEARQPIRDYLHNLMRAIDQLNDGTVHPMLRPETREAGRVPDRTDIWRVRVRVCLALHCFEHDGRGRRRREIAASIAKKHPVFKKLMRSGTGKKHGLAGAILSWHHAFQQGKAIAQDEWENGIRLIEELCRADPTQYARMADIQLDLANKAAAALL